MAHLKTPEFKSEAEEASWWDNNPDLLLKEFETAAKDGTLGRGTLVRRGQTPTTTIRLDPTDIELAKSQAEQRGLKYQTYLKMIIHQALRQNDPKKVTKADIQRRVTAKSQAEQRGLKYQTYRQDDHPKKATKAVNQRRPLVPPERRKHV